MKCIKRIASQVNVAIETRMLAGGEAELLDRTRDAVPFGPAQAGPGQVASCCSGSRLSRGAFTALGRLITARDPPGPDFHSLRLTNRRT